MDWSNSEFKYIYIKKNLKLKKNIKLCYYDSCVENKSNYILTIKMLYDIDKCFMNWNIDHSIIACEILTGEFILSQYDDIYVNPYITILSDKKFYENNLNEMIEYIVDNKINNCIINYKDNNSLKISSMWTRYMMYGDDNSLLNEEIRRQRFKI